MQQNLGSDEWVQKSEVYLMYEDIHSQMVTEFISNWA